MVEVKYSSSTTKNNLSQANNMTYDLNGNIKTLNRSLQVNETDASLTTVDQLAYNYTSNTSNRLKGVKDNSNNTTYFNDKNGTDTDYTYDFAGNMTADGNKAISQIKYNHSNLPYEITIPGPTGGNIKYWYGGGAQKVRKIVHYNDTAKPDKITDYISGLVYETSATLGNHVLEFIPTAEGRAVLKTNIYKNPSGAAIAAPTAGGPYLYEYSLKDHLGNLRVACRCGDPTRDQAGAITSGTEPLHNVQENHYDPWGMSLGTPPDTKQANLNNRYQYNGKELTEDFDIGLYEYGFRWYDTQIAKFVQVDPLAEKYMDLSSNSFVFNNPLRFVDPDGRKPFDIIVKGTNNSSFTIETKLVNSKINLSDYGLSYDFGGNYSISTNELIPDAIGLDLGLTGNLPVLSGNMGFNLIWHTRGEKSADASYPEIHTYKGGQISANSEASVGGNISLLLAWATKANGTMASDDYVANGLNWTGKFFGASVALGEAIFAGGGSYFTAREPFRKAKGEAWSGMSIGWTPQLSATGGLGKIGGLTGKVLDNIKKGTLGGALSLSYYWMNYGNGSDHFTNGKDISGWHIINPIDAPKDDK